jgi:hypothetical protein
MYLKLFYSYANSVASSHNSLRDFMRSFEESLRVILYLSKLCEANCKLPRILSASGLLGTTSELFSCEFPEVKF